MYELPRSVANGPAGSNPHRAPRSVITLGKSRENPGIDVFVSDQLSGVLRSFSELVKREMMFPKKSNHRPRRLSSRGRRGDRGICFWFFRSAGFQPASALHALGAFDLGHSVYRTGQTRHARDLLLVPYRLGACRLALLVSPFCRDRRDLPVFRDCCSRRPNHFA